MTYLKRMDSRDQQKDVMAGTHWQGKGKRGRPRKYERGASVEPMPLAMAPPQEFLKAMSSNTVVHPAGNRIPPSTGLLSADGLQEKSRNSFGSEDSGNACKTFQDISFQISVSVQGL